MTAELTLVVPTYNERENIQLFLNAVSQVLQNRSWELIFVDDDSPDGTYEIVRNIARSDSRIRCIRRVGRKGLSSACIEGILASSSPYICIMDADMQHDESLLPKMLEILKSGDKDIVIGSRYIGTGSTGALPSHRVWISRAATKLGNLILRVPVSDPMSGFFMLKRDFFESVIYQLSGKGFKILLDMLVSSKQPMKVMELPYVMRERKQGESKLDIVVTYEFFSLIANKALGRLLPLRFILFVLVGLSGVIVHLISLGLMFRLFEVRFFIAQFLSAYIAMTSNFLLNNSITYKDRKLKGSQLISGLFSFYLSCTLGAIVNVALADYLFGKDLPWWLAGVLGAVAGAVWNYAVTAIFTWGERSTEKDNNILRKSKGDADDKLSK